MQTPHDLRQLLLEITKAGARHFHKMGLGVVPRAFHGIDVTLYAVAVFNVR